MTRTLFQGPLALALTGLLFASCATQQEFKDAVDLAKHYEGEAFALQAENARLKRDNTKLNSELAMSQVNALEAGAVDPTLEARLAEYERRLAGLSSNPDSISKVDLGGGAYVYMVPDAVLFASGSAEVGAEGERQLLEVVAADINSGGHGRIWVRGHTDSVPVAKPATLEKYPHGNLQLSVARAIEVAAILTGAGNIARDEVVVAGFGPSEPLVANDTAEHRQLNRRVEIFVSPPQ
jgi:flagellar motor protein MotB